MSATPQDMQALRDLFAQVTQNAGLRLHGTGHGYSNGDFFDMAVELPDGSRIYVCLEESQDDEYDEDPDEPQEGDYVMYDDRRGVALAAFAERYIGNFPDRDAAEREIRRLADETGFHPTVWFMSDHGNYHWAEDFSYDPQA